MPERDAPGKKRTVHQARAAQTDDIQKVAADRGHNGTLLALDCDRTPRAPA
jgi:hypothetical protein